MTISFWSNGFSQSQTPGLYYPVDDYTPPYNQYMIFENAVIYKAPVRVLSANGDQSSSRAKLAVKAA
jgi:hypothetical protein